MFSRYIWLQEGCKRDQSTWPSVTAAKELVSFISRLDEGFEAREIRRHHLAHRGERVAFICLERGFRLPVHPEGDAARRIAERLDRDATRIGLLVGLPADVSGPCGGGPLPT